MNRKSTETLWICLSESPFHSAVLALCSSQTAALGRSEMTMSKPKESRKRKDFTFNQICRSDKGTGQFWFLNWNCGVKRLWDFPLASSDQKRHTAWFVFTRWQRKDALHGVHLKAVVRDRNKGAFWLPGMCPTVGGTSYIYICGS